MQYNAWFMLGSAAFRTEKWDIAARAFRTCTHLEPDVIKMQIKLAFV